MPHLDARYSDLEILADLRKELRRAFRAAELPRKAWDRPSRRSAHRWLLPAGGLAAAAAAVAAVLVGLVAGGARPPMASAAPVLRRVAAVAAEQPSLVPRNDQFFYVRSRTTDLMAVDSMSPTEPVPANLPADRLSVSLITRAHEVWTSIARPGRLQETLIRVHHISGPSTRRAELGNSAARALAPRIRYRLGNQQLTRAQLLGYPTNPKTIYHLFRAGVNDAGPSPDAEVYISIGDALRDSPAPPALRSGLYRALALVPGIQLLGTVIDDVGRSGTAVALTFAGVRHELIFDPHTAEMLAERDIAVSSAAMGQSLPAGTIVSDTTYLSRAVTDTTR